MSNDIYLKDILDVDDNIGPKGYVVITDENGNVLVKKHNMIVKGGKSYIFDAFYSKFFGTDTNTNSNRPDIPSDSDSIASNDYKLTYIRFGNNSSITNFTDRYIASDKSRHLAEIDITLDNTGGSVGSGDFGKYSYSTSLNAGISNNHPYISIGTELLFDQSVNITSLSEIELILAKNGDTTDRKLFSRVTFDKIPVTAGATFNLIYYIYF